MADLNALMDALVTARDVLNKAMDANASGEKAVSAADEQYKSARQAIDDEVNLRLGKTG